MKTQTTGVYLIKDNKVLFLVRNKKNDIRHKQGIYLPIGGHVELGESIEECAVREVREESGITVRSVDLKGIVNARGHGIGKSDNIMFLFTSKNFAGEAVSGNEGGFIWVPIEDIKNANLYEGDRIYFDYLFKYKFFVVDFLYKRFELLSHKLLAGF